MNDPGHIDWYPTDEERAVTMTADPLDSHCEDWGGGLTLCFGGSHDLAREFEDTYRWCFGCRRRVRYNFVLYGDLGPSYYEPTWSAYCPNGCGDRASGGFWYVSWNGGDDA